MTRLHVASRSRSRSANTWPTAFLNTSASPHHSESPHHSGSPHLSGIPHLSGSPYLSSSRHQAASPNHSASAHHSASIRPSTSTGSPNSDHLFSSDGEHSPAQDVRADNQWHEGFLRPNVEPANTEQSANRSGLLPIEFNSIGQPIGDSKRFSTKVGKIVRSTVSPHYNDWRIVPWDLKEEVWRSMKNYYDVPEYVKDKIIGMANKCWRNGKTPLRKKCDKLATVAEKKPKVPGNQKKEEWEAFVEMVSEEKDQVLRERGRLAREAVKALHSTGRDGIARRRHVLEQQSPTGSVSRSHVYVATHIYQELPEEQLQQLDPDSYEARCRRYVGMVKDLLQTEQYRDETHLDRDAVAEVFGKDGRVFVRGMGGGVSKTELLSSAIPRDQLRQEKLKNRTYEDRLRFLEERFQNVAVGSNSPNPSRQDMTGAGTSQPRRQAVVLRNMRMKPVAFATLDLSVPSPSEAYHLVEIREVLLDSEQLCEDTRNFAEVRAGDFYLWPQHSVCSWPVGGGAM